MKITKKLLTSVIVVIMAFSFMFCALADTSAVPFLDFSSYTDGLFGTLTDGLFGSATDGLFGSFTDGLFGSDTDADAAVTGDIDEDNTITAADARLILRAAVGLEELSSLQKKAADVDGDGAITAADARSVLRAAVGLELL